jgi:serralysin
VLEAEGDQLPFIRLNGAGGDDTLFGAGGKEHLYGGDGDDLLGGGGGSDLHHGGAGFDIADYADAPAGELFQIGPEANDRLARGVLASLRDYIANRGEIAEGDSYELVEGLRGSRYADTLEGDEGDNLLDGNDGYDRLSGFGGDDTLEASDTARIGGGPFVNPDADDDWLDGGEGFDIVSYANARAQTIGIVASLANPSANTEDAEGDHYVSIEGLRGTRSGDLLHGDAGDNLLEGGGGADLLDGAGGRDTASYAHAEAAVVIRMQDAVQYTLAGTNPGEAEGDSFRSVEDLLGSAFDDALTGNRTANRLEGGEGADTLSGGGGSDTLVGGAGDDRLTGGGHADLFVLDLTAEGVDRITDFKAGADSLMLLGATGSVTYDAATGRLYHDANGAAPEGLELVAIFTGRPALETDDILFG